MNFKDHFSAHASTYADARPRYPPELFAWLGKQCPRRRLAWDAGCGNGQASVALAEYFNEVYATDPSQAQIDNAIAHERVHYAVENAEDCSLADTTANLVTVAQAYHWFEHGRFCEEARRVLAPDGVIAMWSYAESRVAPQVDVIVDELHHRTLGEDWPAERQHVLDRYRELPFPFRSISSPPFEMRSDWNLHQYLAYLSSWSASQRHARRTGEDAVAAIDAPMRAAWGDPEAVRTVEWPLLLLVGRR
ncbi:MAG: class I SAM-dependent methyltransferase [Arenimonas sp.]